MPGLKSLAVQGIMVWHGLLVGAWVVAYLSAEASDRVHNFAGYTAVVLLALRLAAAALAPEGSPLAFPWPAKPLWRTFGRKMAALDLSVFRNRTPFAPLSGAAVLATTVLAVLSGLLADAFDWEDPHEAAVHLSLAAVMAHLAVVALPQLLKALAEGRRPTSRNRSP